MIKRFEEFINETVYIGLIGLKDYSMKSFRPSHAIAELTYFDDRKISLLVQVYGKAEDKELIVKKYDSSFDVDEDSFRYSIEKLVYILNKNQLKDYFKISSIFFDKHLEPYAILKSDNIMSIERLEQLMMSTKIINPKIKDTKDLDKLIYQTK